MIEEGIAKVTHVGVTSVQILTQVNQTAEALKKPKKYWTESDSDIDGMIFMILLQNYIIISLTSLALGISFSLIRPLFFFLPSFSRCVSIDPPIYS